MKSNNSTRIMITIMACFLLALAVFLAPAHAKRSDEARHEFRGIVTQRPADTLVGSWVIGGQPVQADQATEFDQAEGPLDLGSCAKVKIRNGRVHEIDSEPLHDCK